jgi:hypothetical protein
MRWKDIRVLWLDRSFEEAVVTYLKVVFQNLYVKTELETLTLHLT